MVLGFLTVLFFFFGVNLGGTVGGSANPRVLVPVLMWSTHFVIYWLTVRNRTLEIVGGLLLYGATVALLWVTLNDEHSTAGVWLLMGPFILVPAAVGLALLDYLVRLPTERKRVKPG